MLHFLELVCDYGFRRGVGGSVITTSRGDARRVVVRVRAPADELGSSTAGSEVHAYGTSGCAADEPDGKPLSRANVNWKNSANHRL